MDDVITLAGALGKGIAQHERLRELRAAEKAVDDDPDTKQLTQKFAAQQRKLAELEYKNAPIEPEDKRALADLEDKARANSKSCSSGRSPS